MYYIRIKNCRLCAITFTCLFNFFFFGGGGVRARYSVPFCMTWPLDQNLSLIEAVLPSGSKKVWPLYQPLKMMALYFFEKQDTPNPLTQCHIPKDLNPHMKYWWFQKHSIVEMKCVHGKNIQLKSWIKLFFKHAKTSVISSLWCLKITLCKFVTIVDITHISLVCKEMVLSWVR